MRSGKEVAYRIVLMQALAVVSVAVLMFPLQGMRAASAVLAGGLVNVLPNLFFARVLFARTGAQAAGYILGAFWLGECGKLIFSGALFFIVLKWLPISVPLVFVGCLAALIAGWIAPFRVRLREQKSV